MKIQTYTPTNVKFEYGGDDFRVEIYIKERTDKDKIKAATKKGEIYKPEKKEVVFKIREIDLEIKPPLSPNRTTKVREAIFNFEDINYSAFICAFSESQETKELKYKDDDW